VDELIGAGMAVARINGAHDGPAQWRSMVALVRTAAARHGRRVPIVFDLPGPKLRTGPLEPGPDVIRVKPVRDAYGRVTEPAAARFSAAGTAGADGVAGVPLDAATVAVAEAGDRLVLRDSRERRRVWRVQEAGDGRVIATAERTCYFSSGLPVELRRRGKVVRRGRIGPVSPTEPSITLEVGDRLELRAGDAPGRGPYVGVDGVARPAMVSVAVPEVFATLRPGHRVLLDDGKWTAMTCEVSSEHAVVEVQRAGGRRLRAQKGINLPDTELPIAAFTAEDAAILDEVADQIDLVALSFVDDPADVERLQAHLRAVGSGPVGIVLKIERRSAFDALPALLLQALRQPPVAVMVARGDLGVEVGFERLAEVQEEILWLCEAAHVPVIWATQVLETMAKRGIPTRAEVTDAAWAIRAECVMLNKGPYIPEVIDFLDGILTRMHDHQRKRTPILRPLAVAAGTGAGAV
jgi:pyruvate kinase